jgi:hypothetical protein
MNINVREKLSRRGERALTKHDHVMLPNMLALDDAFLVAQFSQPRTTNNKSCAVPPPNTETPIAPWGLIIAYLALLASLGLIFVIAATGGLNLG